MQVTLPQRALLAGGNHDVSTKGGTEMPLIYTCLVIAKTSLLPCPKQKASPWNKTGMA